MSDAGDSHHKRSKSSAALSILRRKERSDRIDRSGNGNGADDDLQSDDGSGLTLLAPTPTSVSLSPSQSSQHTAQSATHSATHSPPKASQLSTIKGHSSRMSGTSHSLAGRSSPVINQYGVSPSRNSILATSPGGLGSAPASSPGGAAAGSTAVAAAGNGHNSLEQSVRKFRIVEALRNGDTAAISKAIRESAVATAASDPSAPRASTSTLTAASSASNALLDDTTVLHLAIQCAEFSVVEFVLANSGSGIDVNARDKDGNTPMHLAASQGRTQVVRLLLDRKDINDSIPNNQGRVPLDLARNPDIFQMLQLSRSLFADNKVKEVQSLIGHSDYKALAEVLEEPRLKTVLDINSTEFVSDPVTIQAGGTLLHEAARHKNTQLIQVLLLHGADPFRRDRKGKLPQDVTKDDVTRAMLKKSPAAVAAQRGIQEKAVLGAAAQGGLVASASAASGAGASSAIGSAGLQGTPADPLAGREARELKGYLKKWTNYRKGYQLRWFVLEDGVLSYYKHQDDTSSACRGAINMRIARLHMSPDEKTKFEIIGKSSVKYTLKANHEVEAKRWFWALNNSIQWTKDQAKEEDRQRARGAELLRQAKEHQQHQQAQGEGASVAEGGHRNSGQISRVQSQAKSISKMTAAGASSVALDDDAATTANLDFADGDGNNKREGGTIDDDDDDYDDADGSSAHERHSPTATRDAFNITAQSAKVQLETMAQVNQALIAESTRSPALTVSDPKTSAALSTYDSAIRSLTGLVGDLVRISRDRDAFWQYRLDREVEMRRMWEESMAQVAKEQEELEARISEAEEKKKAARRILKEVVGSGVLEERPPSSAAGTSAGTSGVLAASAAAAAAAAAAATAVGVSASEDMEGGPKDKSAAPSSSSTTIAHANAPGWVGTSSSPKSPASMSMSRRMTVMEQVADMSDSETEEEEFFDAVDAGEVEVESNLPANQSTSKELAVSGTDISASFKGYENGLRTHLKIDADNRPKISLWGILKSMVGKDMTKMTLPVTFNEPTSLLYRCGEDLEYTDLLDLAVERSDSIERLVYVAAFASSEYASSIGRVAKPFNPLLGETFEYVRPDKNYRFFIEQVSHHPPVAAAWAESPHWTYYGESAVKSKFYGKSFDIHHLGTWFLKLQPAHGGKADFYSWKKVTSTVVGIITGNPTVDNYGPMEVKNWTTGEVAYVDFKPRGWTAASAYQVSGKVTDASGRVRMSLGGRWNSKLYARLTPGFQVAVTEPSAGSSEDAATQKVHAGSITDQNRAFLIWKANDRPKGIPFNLTPFVLTFNHIDENLRRYIAPTDSRLRPDQRAMEDGEYDFAATEKNRLEEEQRARRRARDAKGDEFVPAWFERATCPTTGIAYWQFNGKYWEDREVAGTQGDTSVWDKLEPLFVNRPVGDLGLGSRQSTFAN